MLLSVKNVPPPGTTARSTCWRPSICPLVDMQREHGRQQQSIAIDLLHKLPVVPSQTCSCLTELGHLTMAEVSWTCSSDAYPSARTVQFSLSSSVIASCLQVKNSVEKINSSSSKKLNTRDCMSWPSASKLLQADVRMYNSAFSEKWECMLSGPTCHDCCLSSNQKEASYNWTWPGLC